MSEERMKFTIESDDFKRIRRFIKAEDYHLILSEIYRAFHNEWKFSNNKDWKAWDLLNSIFQEYNFDIDE